VSPLAARALAAVRAEVGRRAAEGGPGDALDADAIAAALEADPACRADLEAAAAARAELADELVGGVTGPRASRRARRDAALAAVDELLVAGELAPDGPGRVVLPGFGPATWRAIAVLRAGGGPEGTWAATVAAGPLADLGAAAPRELVAHPADPRRAGAARRLLARQADRQDLRDALIRAGGAARHATTKGYRDSLAAIEREAAALAAEIARADADIAALWDAGASGPP
jgi:hypothetical protein